MVKKVVVTGGVACGKSTVCGLFELLGATVVSTDALVHHFLEMGHPVAREVIALLGDDIVVDNTIDRTRIASKVFGDRDKLHALEAILHPRVRDEVARIYSHLPRDVPLFVVEIPLYYEAGEQGDYDAVIAVVAEDSVCRERFRRKASTSDDYAARVERQLSKEEKRRHADYVIENNGDKEALRRSVERLYATLVEEGMVEG